MGRQAEVTRGKGGTGRRAQSSVIGAVLVLGMVVIGASFVVALGSTAMNDMQTQSELDRAEHSMTLFNSRTSMVALGDSTTQTVSFGRDGGSYEIVEDDSWLRITHANYTNSNVDETVYNESIGSVVYRNDGTEIAYQGGGVWRQEPHGEAQMVSPPEFHYRSATLTLPIVRVHEVDEGRSGSTAEISRVSSTKRVFPNSTSVNTNRVGAPYNDTHTDYRNPVANGTVNVTVQSPYYEGWAQYFRSNTDGDVKEFPDDNRVRVTLTSIAGSIGDFEMPAEGNSLNVRGMGADHPINAYEMTLAADGHFNNMHWAFYSDEGNEEFELNFQLDDHCSGGFDGDVHVSLYYANSSGTNPVHEEWQTTVDPDTNSDFDVDCSGGEGVLTMDLMGSTGMTYEDIDTTGSDNKWKLNDGITDETISSSTTSFDAHVSDPAAQYDPGDDAELGFLVSHYLQILGPRYDLQVTDGPGGSSRVDESASTGTMEFDTATGDQYITYLHVTENDVNVTFR